MTETPPLLAETPDLVGTPVRDPFAVIPEVLDLVRLTGAIFFRADFRAPWAYTSPRTAEIRGALPEGTGSLVMFHVVADGNCWIEMSDGVRHQLTRGDVVVLPYGDAHAWGSTPSTGAEPVSIVSLMPPQPWTEFPRIDHGGDGEPTFIVCGYLRGDAALFDPVLRALPPVLVVHPPEGPAADWLQASIDYAVAATEASSAESLRSMANANPRLPELLFTEVLRLYLEQDDGELTGWLGALRDPIVGPALSALHDDPARNWTVASLATTVAASKTVLADRFTQLLGRPPIRYLTQWRLNLASGLLRTTELSVSEVGARVGYHSEESFSRAFKRTFGTSPVRWRVS